MKTTTKTTQERQTEIESHQIEVCGRKYKYTTSERWVGNEMSKNKYRIIIIRWKAKGSEYEYRLRPDFTPEEIRDAKLIELGI